MGFTGLTNEVCDLYFNHHFPAAIATAAALRKRGGEEQFIYTSHPWLVTEYLDSAVQCASVNTTAEQRQTLVDAIAAGQVSWHAQPFTMLSPMLDPQLFSFSLSLSHALDDRFNKSRKTAASTKDAMGHTVSAVPVFAAAGIDSLHIGANAACVAPDVPPAFLWRHLPTSTQLLTMLYNVPTPSTPCTWTPFCSYGGDVVLPNVTSALVYQFTLDNSSPSTPDDVLSLWAMIRTNYPNAAIVASSLDAFSTELLSLAGSSLPVITDEMGDSWLYGVQSDPYKIAAFRAIARRLPELERSGISPQDISAFKRRLLKNPEHNFGLSVGSTNVNSYGWSNAEFYQHYNDSAADFHKLDQGWRDARNFLYPTADAPQALHKFVHDTYAQLQAQRPDLTQFLPISCSDAASSFIFQTLSYEVGLNCSTGALDHLLQKSTLYEWSGPEHQLGQFRYHSYSADDFARFGGLYTRCDGGCGDFIKPGLRAQDANSTDWNITGIEAWRNAGSVNHTLIVRLQLDSRAVVLYGAMREIWITWEFRQNGAINLTLVWLGKSSTRLPESSWLSFVPRLDSSGRRSEQDDPCAGWTVDVMGQPVLPSRVVSRGTRRLHAVQSGVHYRRPAGGADFAASRVSILSPDVTLVAPEDIYHLLYRDDSLPDCSGGWHYNLHNNLWSASDSLVIIAGVNQGH